MDPLGKWLRFSSSPNCVVHEAIVVAERDIVPGEGLTIPYTSYSK